MTSRHAVLFGGVALAGIFGLAVGSSACSNGGGGTDAGNDTGSADAAGDVNVIIDPDNCVKPGTPSNSQGIGGYCSPQGGQCTSAGPGGSATLCSADFGAPAHAWFCTYPCTSDATCGPGASCVAASAGQGCVPASCLYLEGDGGSDASAADAQADGSTDASGD